MAGVKRGLGEKGWEAEPEEVMDCPLGAGAVFRPSHLRAVYI